MMEENKSEEIGKILNSNSHIDYVCEVFRERDREESLSPTDYQFGQFVGVKKKIDEKEIDVIGVIYNSQIMDPEQGRAGPRLSSPEEQEMFNPSYVDEKMTLVGVSLLGFCEIDGSGYCSIEHKVPPWTLEIDDIVRKLSDEEIVSFHEIDGKINLGYYQNLSEIAGPLGFDLLSNIIGQLKELKPEEEKVLDVIQKNIEYKKRIEGV